MKKISTLTLLIFGIITTFCQTSNSTSYSFPVSYENVEVKPEFADGINGFIKFIGDNFKLPDVESLSGTVKVSYVIDIDGKLKDIKVLQDLGEGTGDEAIRVLKLCPLWKPGEQDGIKVKVAMQLPINLKI